MVGLAERRGVNRKSWISKSKVGIAIWKRGSRDLKEEDDESRGE
jgi:hypothetical protein